MQCGAALSPFGSTANLMLNNRLDFFTKTVKISSTVLALLVSGVYTE